MFVCVYYSSLAVYSGTDGYGLCNSISCGMIITVKETVREGEPVQRTKKYKELFKGRKVGVSAKVRKGKRRGRHELLRQEGSCEVRCKLVFSMRVQRKCYA